MRIHKSQSLLALFIVPILVFSSRGQTAPQPNPEDMKRYWQALVPSIPSVLKQAFLNERIEDNHPVRLVETADITGDGIPEAVVDLGEGGAYTDYVTVMRIEEGKAIVALFKEADGKVSGYFFQGASVRHGESERMLPDKKAFYSMSTSTDDYGREDTCGVGAYQWDARRRVFVWNKLLSKQIAKKPSAHRKALKQELRMSNCEGRSVVDLVLRRSKRRAKGVQTGKVRKT
jgi:hypothetical protein